MNRSEWKSLGTTKQFKYVSHREAANKQLVSLVESIEKENNLLRIENKQLLKLADKSVKSLER